MTPSPDAKQPLRMQSLLARVSHLEADARSPSLRERHGEPQVCRLSSIFHPAAHRISGRTLLSPSDETSEGCLF